VCCGYCGSRGKKNDPEHHSTGRFETIDTPQTEHSTHDDVEASEIEMGEHHTEHTADE